MSLRCRFKVESIINHADNTATVEAYEVADVGRGAQLLLHRISPEARAQLLEGAEYFIDIAQVEATPDPAPAATTQTPTVE